MSEAILFKKCKVKAYKFWGSYCTYVYVSVKIINTPKVEYSCTRGENMKN